MPGEAYYPPTMFISNDTPTTSPLRAVHGRSIGIQFLPPCWRLLPLDSSISFIDWVSWQGHTIHKLQGLVFNLCWKIWILIFLVENIQVLALPNLGVCYGGNLGFVQMWFSLDIACWKRMGGLPCYCSGSSWIGLSFYFLFYFSNIIKIW